MALSANVFAAPSLKTSTDLKSKSKHKITDPEIRSEIGSMSKWSISSNISYAGSTLDDPLGEWRPNANVPSRPYTTYMSGSIRGRYRINKMSSITLGSGFNVEKPFQDTAGDLEFKNPNISYSLAHKNGKLVGSLFSGLDIYTTDYDKERRQRKARMNVGYTLKYKRIAGSKFTAGVMLYGSKYFFSRDYQVGDYSKSTDIYVKIKPKLQYRINKRFSLSTEFNFPAAIYRQNVSHLTFHSSSVYQKIGLGTSFTPEIYLYTYLNLYPDNYRFDNTYYGLSLTMSLF
jgi:hypothetical protein